MKNKILSLCLGFSLLLIAILCFCFLRYKPECERLHLDDVVEKGRNIIPDEETAKEIAYVLVEANLGFEDLGFYEAEVNFNEETNEWEVFFHQMTYEGEHILGGGRVVHLNRDSGMVTELYCDRG